MELVRDALIVFLVGLVLYGATVAPTVLWADGGHLQLNAVEGTLQGSAGSHPLWVWISHQFTKVPVGDIAGRVNFVSGVFGAATIALLYLVLREMGLDREPSALAILALTVSHTFWSYSVRAEVYTLTLAMMVLQMWLGLRWFNTGQRGYLVGLGLALGLGLAAHLLVVVYVPALVWLLWRGRTQLDVSGGLASSFALAVSVSPLVALIARDAQTYGLRGAEIIRWALFSFEGYDFGGAFLDFSLALFPSDLFQWVAFLGIQFVGLSGICGLIGVLRSWRVLERSTAVYLGLLYAGAFAFGFAYRVGDRYVFYLPSYLPFAAWIGVGWQWILGKLREQERMIVGGGCFHGLLAVLVVIVPVTAYRVAPELVAQGATFRDTRRVPGGGSKYFFLWPPKMGYQDARIYAEEALEAAPQNCVILADPILRPPLQFLQVVGGKRPDVTLRYCCWDIDDALAEAEGRPVALADVAPEVYPVEHLRNEYDIRPQGPIYLLTREHR
ncbi:MAG: DUF2723 domain-containing protein [Chloroflexota bacterium]|nr:DUF2723 domain-containing protein [Chloroflexota bacterium]